MRWCVSRFGRGFQPIIGSNSMSCSRVKNSGWNSAAIVRVSSEMSQNGSTRRTTGSETTRATAAVRAATMIRNRFMSRLEQSVDICLRSLLLFDSKHSQQAEKRDDGDRSEERRVGK